MRRTTFIILGLAVALLAGGGWWAVATRVGPAPLVPPSLDAFDDTIADAIRRAAADVERAPGRPRPRFELGAVYEANGLTGYAVRTYRQIIETGDADANTWYRLACALEADGDITDAITAARASIALDDDVPWVQWRLAMWLIDAGDADAAASHLDRAEALDPADPAVAFARVRLLLLDRQRLEDAERIIVERNLLDPNVGRTYGHRPRDYGHALLAAVLRARGAPEQAATRLAFVRNATPVFRDPSETEVLSFRTGRTAVVKRGEQLVAAGKYRDARVVLERAFAASPEPDVGLVNLLAICAIELGDTERGLTLLDGALQRDPDAFQNLANLTEAHLRVTKDPDVLRRVVFRYANEAVARRPRFGPARALRARVHLRLGAPDQAALDFKEAFALDARTPSHLVDAGWAELQAGDVRTAAETFRRALELEVTLADAHAGLAVVLTATGRLDDARRSIQQAAALRGRADRLEAARRQLAATERQP